MAIAKRLIVSGHVQGVGFRYFTQSTALAYKVKGWVRNLSDGTVEIHAEAEEEQFDSFKQALRDGNRFVGVERIEETDIAEEGHRKFDIRY
ncbi:MULTISPECIES: acylphosphatase [Exiguobacterium]|uniref:acylphosphatase n=1 Tax=Exiguobacterium TaxID=33986 RepID=UPI001BE7C805|nr:MULTISPECIES: acylphosphatase [Exiguobacterium]MCT4784081.1 acylphosphatase [Exiguobacterium himgiriensis]